MAGSSRGRCGWLPCFGFNPRKSGDWLEEGHFKAAPKNVPCFNPRKSGEWLEEDSDRDVLSKLYSFNPRKSGDWLEDLLKFFTMGGPRQVSILVNLEMGWKLFVALLAATLASVSILVNLEIGWKMANMEKWWK